MYIRDTQLHIGVPNFSLYFFILKILGIFGKLQLSYLFLVR